MSLVFAAVTPHPPMLIPAIGKEHLDRLAATKAAMEALEQELYLTKPNVIIIISPHSSIFAESFSVNVNTHFTSSFEQFGDLATKREWMGAPDFAAKLSHEAKLRDIPVQLTSIDHVDHGAGVSLYYLTNHLPDTKILPIGYSALPTEKHIAYGELLKDVIMATSKRVAVIASGDLSHCLTDDAPSGLKPEGKTFDETFIKLLTAHDTDGLVTLDPALINAAEECGYRSTLILMGILKNMNVEFKTLSYEHPFGVGYLVGQFIFR